MWSSAQPNGMLAQAILAMGTPCTSHLAQEVNSALKGCNIPDGYPMDAGQVQRDDLLPFLGPNGGAAECAGSGRIRPFQGLLVDTGGLLRPLSAIPTLMHQRE